ncbi:MAG: magnesium and cobalt transport protein [Gammaproteobacteria bacterium]|jgi:magnesium transporter|nr:magnesium and cobalt transport protein [Gammaproteobacteria bacterium]
MNKYCLTNDSPGKEPGTLMSGPEAAPTEVKVIVYNAKHVNYYTLNDLVQHKVSPGPDEVLWVEVTGLKDVEVIKTIGTYFSFHPLALEDTLNTYQRAKVDDYTGYQFIVTKLLDTSKEPLASQQLSIFLGHNYVVTFLERPSPLNLYFEKNIANSSSRLRARAGDYLAYELLDYATDTVFPILSKNSDILDGFENSIMEKPTARVIRQVQFFKRELRFLRQILWSNRDMLSSLMRNELDLISEGTTVFFRDCYDHAVRQMDLLESQRESAVSLVDIYLSSMANRLGQVMKILTVISIVFMPPTFLAAVWGMNFKYMPELEWTHGYLFAWIIMILSSVLPSLYFWRRGWLREDEK